MSVNPVLSVIIVSYQVRDLLRTCLLSLNGALETSTNEVWVVDNASLDGSVEMVSKEFPRIHFIKNTRNLGFARAANQAFRQVTGKYLLLLNPDTVVNRNAILAMQKFLEARPQAAIVGPRLRDGRGHPQRSFWPFPSLGSTLMSLSGLRRWSGKNHRSQGKEVVDDWEKEETRRVDWLSGACMLVRRSAVEEVGFLDEAFFMFGEDVDWCKRFSSKGWSIWFHPEAQIVHYGKRSTASFDSLMNSNLWLLQTGRNEALYFYKHQGVLSGWLLNFISVVFSLLSWTKWGLLAKVSSSDFPKQRAQLYRCKVFNNFQPTKLTLRSIESELRKGKQRNLYSRFIKKGDLCFDIGAHVGETVEIFLDLGASVVAVEPQSENVEELRKRYQNNKNVTLIPKGLDERVGEQNLKVCSSRDCSSISQDYIGAVTQSGRLPVETYQWSGTEHVTVTTLDLLIQEYGIPAFCKIDVEGYENKVLKGLSQPLRAISFEFTPEYLDPAFQSLERLSSLGPFEFNYSLGKSAELALSRWITKEEIVKLLMNFSFPVTCGPAGDVYARLRSTQDN